MHPNRSARSHLAWMAASNKLPKSSVDKALEMVGLTSVANKRAGAYSLGMSQRLGIAGRCSATRRSCSSTSRSTASTRGIVWIRTFMHRLADEGRTVLVSSHLLSEMALTAAELIVIGRGRLIAQNTTEFVDRASGTTVKVRTPQLDQLAGVLNQQRLVTRIEENENEGKVLFVEGDLTTDQVGEAAAAHGIVLHELSLQRGSLEQAFMQMTGDSVQYHAHDESPTSAT